MRTAIRCLTVFALLALPLPLLAQANPIWSAVASTGTLDESSYTPAVNFAFGSTSLGFLGANTGSIVARYNVTNVAGAVNPFWTHLELGAVDTAAAAGNFVQATLYAVDPCNGNQNQICQVTSSSSGANGECFTCQFGGPLDFINFLYYVEVKIVRSAAGNTEQALTLRIY